MACFWKVTRRINVRFQEILRKLENLLGCTHADNVQGKLLVSIVPPNSDAVVCCPCTLRWGVSSIAEGLLIIRSGLFSMGRVMFCSDRVHQQGGRYFRPV